MNDPERYGIVEFDDNENVLSLRRNPKNQNPIMRSLVFIFMIIRL